MIKEDGLEDKIISCIESNGIKVSESGELEDIDSLSFIAAIVGLEELFNIEFPDEYLESEKIQNISGFIYIIDELLKNKE